MHRLSALYQSVMIRHKSALCGTDWKVTQCILKGTNIQQSDHTGPKYSKLKKTIEIQLVRPTEVCGKY